MNPENWIGWGSFGIFNAFRGDLEGDGSERSGLVSVTAWFLPINGIIPSTSRVFN